MEFLDGIRADGRLILSADIDGALGTKAWIVFECLWRLITLHWQQTYAILVLYMYDKY